jgi:Na+/H+ antiporter NhaA
MNSDQETGGAKERRGLRRRMRATVPRLSRFAVEHLLLLPLGALIAMVWVNTAPESYYRFSFTIAFAVNEIAMAFFFALMTKEVVEATAPGGVLHSWRRAMLPVIAAVAATALPALIYGRVVAALDEPMLVLAWPVAMATDLAIGYFVLRLIFRSHPVIPFFLLLGIGADALGFLALAFLNPTREVDLVTGVAMLAVAGLLAAGLRWWRVVNFWPYLIGPGVVAWLACFWSGLHPALSLVPIIFLRQPPAPRHYYLGLPGLAILFACAFPSWRTMMVATPVFALLTITNVHLYARESWVAVGARLTKTYLSRIETLLQETGRSSFYVMDGGDPHFFWHVDGGAALPFMLGKDATFRFAVLNEPLETDKWLNNGVNVVFAQNGKITDAVKTGEFPPTTDPKICSIVRGLTNTERDCSILFRGQPLNGDSITVDTPGHLPVFEVPEGLVTLSRTTIRIAADEGFQLRSHVLVDPKSVDGMLVEIYGYHAPLFTKEFSQPLIPGEHRELSYVIPPDVFEYVLIRIHPGPNSDEQNDRLVWETQSH